MPKNYSFNDVKKILKENKAKHLVNTFLTDARVALNIKSNAEIISIEKPLICFFQYNSFLQLFNTFSTFHTQISTNIDFFC